MYEDYSSFLINRFKNLFGKDLDKLINSYSKSSKKAIRINTNKISVEKCIDRLSKKGFRFSKVPWCDYAFFVEKESSSLPATVEYMMGYFFIQDPTSFVPVIELNPGPNDVVLDMTAAPGGKTTHLSQLMNNKGVILAAEIDKRRIKGILYNIGRMSAENVISVRTDAREIKDFGLKFSKILLDAPCTADGTIAKNERIKQELKQEDYQTYAKKQKELLEAAKEVLVPGGELVYATCSTAPEENEEVVEYAVETLGYKIIDSKTQRYFSEGMTNFFGKKHPDYLKKCTRVAPWQYSTQAFFVAKLRI